MTARRPVIRFLALAALRGQPTTSAFRRCNFLGRSPRANGGAAGKPSGKL
jgi:hypothetical protein